MTVIKVLILTDRIKIAWVYLFAAFFLAVNLYLVVQKDFYYAFSLLVLRVLLLYIFFTLIKCSLVFLFPFRLMWKTWILVWQVYRYLAEPYMLFGVMILFLIKAVTRKTVR